MEELEAFKCSRGFRRDCEIYFRGMAAVKRHRTGTGFASIMINNDLEYSDHSLRLSYGSS